jgi:hypothetical protein
MKTEEELSRTHSLQAVQYDPKKGYPRGEDLHYRCPRCNTYMPSDPADYDEAQCRCRYLSIDIDAGRLSLGAYGADRQEPALVRLVAK